MSRSRTRQSAVSCCFPEALVIPAECLLGGRYDGEWRMANGEWRVSLEEREATTSASSGSRSTSVEASVAVGLMAVIEGAASTTQSAS